MSRKSTDHSDVESGRYFARRKPRSEVSFGEHYWRFAADPDGVVRDRTGEREQHLDDLRQELEFVKALSPGRILDIGCGLGFFLSGVDGAWERHGVEVSEFAAGFACEWADVHKGTLESSRFPMDHFDVVVCHHVIEHIDDPRVLMAEIRRILRPGGHLLLGTPDFDSGCARRFGEKYRLLNDPTHISLFSYESLLRFVRDSGFMIDRVEFPFFGTRHFTRENLDRLFDTSQVSPPFYGNFITLYCRKPTGGILTTALQNWGSFAGHEMSDLDTRVNRAIGMVSDTLAAGGLVYVDGSHRLRAIGSMIQQSESSARAFTWLDRDDCVGSRDLVIVVASNDDREGDFLQPPGPGICPSDRTIVLCDEAVSSNIGEAAVVLGVPIHEGWSPLLVLSAVLELLLEETSQP